MGRMGRIGQMGNAEGFVTGIAAGEASVSIIA